MSQIHPAVLTKSVISPKLLDRFVPKFFWYVSGSFKSFRGGMEKFYRLEKFETQVNIFSIVSQIHLAVITKIGISPKLLDRFVPKFFWYVFG